LWKRESEIVEEKKTKIVEQGHENCGRGKIKVWKKENKIVEKGK